MNDLNLRTNQEMHKQRKPDHWRSYHTADVLAQAEKTRKSYTIESTGVRIHIDMYEQQASDAPVLIFNHGGGGYSRLFLPLALELHRAGYTVLLPDQRGQGLSGGSRSDFEMGQFVTNIVDAAHWARKRYTGPLFMAGASLGGALTYNAAAAGAPVQAIICHNLYDFGDPQDTLAVSKFAPLAHVPGIAALFAKATRLLAALAPRMRLPYMMLGKFDKMVDERNKDFFPLYRHDPYPIRWITLRYLASTFYTAPAIPFEKNTVPVLVINQTRDQMVDPAVTLKNYHRLGGEKRYAEIDFGHWAIGHGFEAEWVKIVDDFLRPLVETS